MSNPYNDQVEQHVYEAGYDAGYEDCRSEMQMKIFAILRLYLYDEKYTSPMDLSKQIYDVLKKKVVEVGE